MILITKDNLESFIQHYQGFHDSWFSNINYNIKEAKIEVLVDVFWSGEPTLKEDGTYETNKVKVKMNLNGVEQCNIKELFSWDSINDVFIKYITIKMIYTSLMLAIVLMKIIITLQIAIH